MKRNIESVDMLASPILKEDSQPAIGVEEPVYIRWLRTPAGQAGKPEREMLAAWDTLRSLLIAVSEEDPEAGWSESFAAAHSRARALVGSVPQPSSTKEP